MITSHPLRRLLLSLSVPFLAVIGVSCAQDSAVQPEAAEVLIMRDSAVGHYHPPVATVAVGGAVTWTNDSGVVHNVVFDDDRITDSALFGDGEQFSATFDAAGRYTYVCTIHPGMTGAVIVK